MKEEVKSMEDVVVSGVALDNKQAKVVVSDVPDRPGAAAQLFQSLAQADVCVDMIVQNIGREGKANMTFTVPRDDVSRSEKAVQSAFPQDSTDTQFESSEVAIVSIVGVGMQSHSGVAATLFDTLAKHEINIQLVSTSEIKISVAISPESAEKVTRLIHSAYGLDADA